MNELTGQQIHQAFATGPSAEATTVQKPYMVVCADMAYYCENERSLGDYELVYTCAQDAEAACVQAKLALRDCGIPLAAFSHADLQRIMTEMDECKLLPGQAGNWTRGMTDVQMQAAYSGVTDGDELGL